MSVTLWGRFPEEAQVDQEEFVFLGLLISTSLSGADQAPTSQNSYGKVLNKKRQCAMVLGDPGRSELSGDLDQEFPAALMFIVFLNKGMGY